MCPRYFAVGIRVPPPTATSDSESAVSFYHHHHHHHHHRHPPLSRPIRTPASSARAKFSKFSFLFWGGCVMHPSVPSPPCAAVVPRATIGRSTRPPFEPVEQTRPGKSHPHPVTSATSANQLPPHWYSTSVCTRLWPLSPMSTLPQLSTRSAWILHEPAISGCLLCADLMSTCSGRLQCVVYLRACVPACCVATRPAFKQTDPDSAPPLSLETEPSCYGN